MAFLAPATRSESASADLDYLRALSAIARRATAGSSSRRHPHRSHQRAAREPSAAEAMEGRAGSHPPSLKLRRTDQHRITDVCYTTLILPAHTRVASRPKSPAPAVATLFDHPATTRAETEAFCSPAGGCGVGSSARTNSLGDDPGALAPASPDAPHPPSLKLRRTRRNAR